MRSIDSMFSKLLLLIGAGGWLYNLCLEVLLQLMQISEPSHASTFPLNLHPQNVQPELAPSCKCAGPAQHVHAILKAAFWSQDGIR